jgi:hypothetical protein
MTTKLLFVSDNVKESDYFTNNLLPDVSYIKISPKDSISVVRDKLESINISTLTHIGLVFDNNSGRAPFIEYTSEEITNDNQKYSSFLNTLSEEVLDNHSDLIEITHNSDKEYDRIVRTKTPIFKNDVIEDNSITPSFHYSNQYFSNDFITLINEIKSNSNLNTIDIISCNLYQHSQFSDLLNNGITVRYSTNITGRNGDWILESHNVNVTPIYFTESVRNYPYQLGTQIPNTQIGSDWVIDNADKMYWLMSYTSNTSPAFPGGPSLASSFILTVDIDMATQSLPINPTRSIGNPVFVGAASSRFIGTLKGNNKTLTIRVIDFPNFTGIFGNFGPGGGLTTSARVENLNVVFTTNTFTYTHVANNVIYSLLCGIMRSGTAENCTISFSNIGNISLTINNTTAAAGSFIEIGLIAGRKQGNCNIKNCIINYSQNASITITANSITGATIGGIVGLAGSGTGTTEISGCQINLVNDLNIIVNSNNITINNESSEMGGMIGSMTGLSGPTLTNVLNNSLTCRNLSLTGPTISGKNNISMFTYYGGFGGNMDFNNVYDNCRVTVTQLAITHNDASSGTGSATRAVFIGGFAGAQTTNTATSIIQNSQVNIGSLNVSCSNGSLTYFDFIGGFTGYADSAPGTIIQTLNSSCTISALSITTSGSGSGSSSIGGCFGYLAIGTVDNLDAIIQNCTFIFNDTNAFIHSGAYMGFKINGNLSNSSILISGTFQTTSNSTKYLYNSGYIGYVDGNTSNALTNCITTINNFNCVSNGTNSNFLNWVAGFLGRSVGATQSISNCSTTITNLNMTLTHSSGIPGDNRLGCIIAENDRSSISFMGSNITNTLVNITQSNSSISFGGLVGYNFASTTQNCNTTLGSVSVQNSETSQPIWLGGVAGQVLSTSNVSNNTTNITRLSLIGRTTSDAFMAGLAAAIYDTASLQNCITTIGENTYIESASVSNSVAMGCLIGLNFSSGSIINNTITYGNYLTLKANQDSGTTNINSTIGQGNILDPSNSIIFVTYPLIFNSIANGTGIEDENGSFYYVQPQKYTITVNNKYNIDLTKGVTFYFYLIPRPVEVIQSCCDANVCNANPVVANYDNRNVVANKGGQTLVGAVDNFYRAAANNHLRPNAPPMFKSYQQMMDWLQRQNRR